MRHRVFGHHLGRDTAHRKALFRNLIRELYLHERIVTTEAKARAVRGDAERLITRPNAVSLQKATGSMPNDKSSPT